MEHKLYFQAHRLNGYSLQLVVDLDNKTFELGYCLAIFKTFIHMPSMKEIYILVSELRYNGFTPKADK